MAIHEPVHDAASEVAAAEVALKAAQEKLEAAKAKLAAEEMGKPVDTAETSTSTEATGVAEEAETGETAEDVQAPNPTPDNASVYGAAPTWVPYSANQTPPTYNASEPQPPHAGPGAVPPQQPYYGYQQPQYYQQPYGQPVVTTKDHVAAGLLSIFLGWLGIHKFYLGYNTAGFIMLAVTILGSLLTFGLAGGVIWVISIIEGILYLTKSQTEFEQIYVVNKRDWF